MVYQIADRSNTNAENRSFQIEVSGLQQNEVAVQNKYSIRSSANTFVTVPFSRLSAEFQRVHRLGGKIESIQPLTDR